MKLPKARIENLLEQNLEKETLIYDLLIDKAFSLNETSTVVYKACNGVMTFDELKLAHKFTDDVIYLALDELKRNNLLTDVNYVSPFAGMNRREVIKKVGLASLIALPVITGLITPTAAHAASACPDQYSQGIPTGCPTSGSICCDPQTCSAQSDETRSNICNRFTSNNCASRTSIYVEGSCTNTSSGSRYSCVCG